MRLIIELKNEEEMRFVKELPARLQIGIVQSEPETTAGNPHPVQFPEEIAQRGVLGKRLEDPVAWQQEMCQERSTEVYPFGTSGR